MNIVSTQQNYLNCISENFEILFLLLILIFNGHTSLCPHLIKCIECNYIFSYNCYYNTKIITKIYKIKI